MRKKVSRKQKTLLILLCSGLVVLVALLGLLAAILINENANQSEDPTEPTHNNTTGVQDISKVYWNLDKEVYFGTGVQREKGPDGYYSVRFVEDDSIYSYRTKDAALLEQIDALHVMGLTLTADGEIVYVHPVEVYTGGVAINWGYVSKVSGSTVICNKSAGLWDAPISLKLSGKTTVYDISTEDVRKISPSDMAPRGQILAVVDQNGNATHIYYKPKYHDIHKEAGCGCYGTGITWKAWDGTGTLEDGGHYYLTQDIQAPNGGFQFSTGTYYIRLDGHTISAKDRVFRVQGDATLYVCDHTTRGTLAGNSKSGEDGGVIRQDGAESAVYLTNIAVTANSNSTGKNGGALYVGGLMCLDNVSVVGGKAQKGGCIYVTANGHLQMYDSTLREGISTDKGGNLYLGGSALLQNVSMRDGSATAGSGIYLEADGAKRNILDNVELSFEDVTTDGICVAKGKLTLSGVVKVIGQEKGNVVLSGGRLQLEGLMEGSDIGISLAAPGIFAENAEQAEIYCFVSDNRELQVLFDGGSKTFQLTDRATSNTHTNAHCVCGGLGKVGDHTECKKLTGWIALDGNVLTEAETYYQFKHSGNYFLAGDFVADVTIEIPFGQEITLCLNGYKLSGEVGIFRVSGTLNICDCHGGDSEGHISSSVEGGVLLDGYASGIINIFGGKLSVTGMDSRVICANNTIGSATSGGKAGIGAIINIYGSEISGGNRMNDHGGNIWATVGTALNIYGGKITGGAAMLGGGNIYSTGTLNILGGEIADGIAAAIPPALPEDPENPDDPEAPIEPVVPPQTGEPLPGEPIPGVPVPPPITGHGGNIYFAYSDTGVLKISGGLILGGEALKGGNIYTEAPLYLTGGDVKRGKAEQSGGNIYLAGTPGKNITHNISGGSVLDGVAALKGGNIYAGANLTLSNCTVAGGRAALAGGVMLEQDVIMAIFGNPVINSNSAVAQDPANPDKMILSNSNLYMALGSSLSIRMVGFGEYAKIGLDMENPGIFASGLATDYSYAFFCDNKLYPVIYNVREKTLSLSDGIDRSNPDAHDQHCVCGGNAVGIAAHGECVKATWTPVFSYSDLVAAVKRGQNAYLSRDLVLDETFDLGEGTFYPVTLCLNGHTITAKEGKVMFVVRDVFNLTDCQKTAEGQFKGTLVGQNLTGAIFRIYNHDDGTIAGAQPTLNIFGGNLKPGFTDTAMASDGGLIQLGSGTGVGFAKEAVLNLYAGNISGGSAQNGGNIFAQGACRINLYGGEIVGGKAAVNGGGIFVSPGCNIYISGNVQLTGSTKGLDANNLYLSKGVSVTLGELAQETQIGFTLEEAAVGTVVATDGTAPTVMAHFLCDDLRWDLSWDEGAGVIRLVERTGMPPSPDVTEPPVDPDVTEPPAGTDTSEPPATT